MLDPQGLYEVDSDVPDLTGAVLLYEFEGFMDAGGAGRLTADHVASVFETRTVARFDVDQLADYRGRRPTMTFDVDRWEHFDAPRLEVDLFYDGDGAPGLLLRGPEPDFQWERFVSAVIELAERWGVRLTVGFHGIPSAAPHTRPLLTTSHGTRPELAAGSGVSVGRLEVPGNVGALLQLRLGEAGHDATGVVVHVPHYLAQTSYPAAALRLLDFVRRSSGLQIPDDTLRSAAVEVDAEVDDQVRQSDQVSEAVRNLELQYDESSVERAREGLLADPDGPIPTGEQLGAELERFLSQRGGGAEQS